MNIKFLDGSVKEFQNGLTCGEIAKSISESLFKKSICAKVNGELVDLSCKVEEDASLELITKDSKEAFEVLNHSCAHLLATAVKKLYKDSAFGIGPSIEEGFYYAQIRGLNQYTESSRKPTGFHQWSCLCRCACSWAIT